MLFIKKKKPFSWIVWVLMVLIGFLLIRQTCAAQKLNYRINNKKIWNTAIKHTTFSRKEYSPHKKGHIDVKIIIDGISEAINYITIKMNRKGWFQKVPT